MGAEKYLNSEAFQIAMNAYKENVKTYMRSGRKEDLEAAEKELYRKMGVGASAEAKRIIEAGDQLQHNAPATVAKKGSGKPPLYETGLMKKNISYEIAED